MKKNVLKSLVALSFLGASVSHAANIVWLSPTDVSSVSDIVTTGSLFDSAAIFSTNDLSINGVTFNHALSPSGGSFSFSNSSGITLSNYSFDRASLGSAPASLGSDYQKLITIASGASDQSLIISLSSLTVGSEYLVQLWTPYWDANNWATSFSGGVNTSNYLNTGYLAGERPAQFVVGSFIADATNQIITSNAKNHWSLISGLQVRTISAVAAVPEPETYAMFMAGLGLMGFIARRRKS